MATETATERGGRSRVEATYRTLARHERALWAVVVLAAIADILLTYHGLQIGLTEANPVARGAIEGYGYWTMVALKGGALTIGVACWAVLPDRFSPVIPLGLAIPWVVASAINLTLILLVS
ncbi:DUF5658 family protein [Natronorarus salvus]|uniref:DUF5658 family protein n=1 Tax=Natronorarus salvus TaxID=3117733 RepID=UPI002F26BD17